MSEISPNVERMIAKTFDFRLLVYLYMYQHPEATKASLASRLGIAPITMSRAIAAGKKGVDKALIPKVLELLGEIDFNLLSVAERRLHHIWLEQGRYERESKLREILCRELNCNPDRWQYSQLPTNLDYVLVQENGTRRYFNEIRGSKEHIKQLISRAMGCISLILGNDAVTFVCYTQSEMESLIDQYAVQIIRSYASTHPITVMQVDLEREEIVAEYLLYEPGRENYNFYEIKDIAEDFE